MTSRRKASTVAGSVLAVLAGVRIAIALAADITGLEPLASRLFAALGASPLAVLNSNAFMALAFLGGVALVLYGRAGTPTADARAHLEAIATRHLPAAFAAGTAALDHITATAYQDPDWPANEAWDLFSEYRSRFFRLCGDRVRLEAWASSKTALQISNSVKEHYASYVELEFWIDSYGRPTSFRETELEERHFEARKVLEHELNVAWGIKCWRGRPGGPTAGVQVALQAIRGLVER